MKPDIDPFSPENILIFTTGPLTGTGHYRAGMLWFLNPFLPGRYLIQAAVDSSERN
jgi:hypothetical protein